MDSPQFETMLYPELLAYIKGTKTIPPEAYIPIIQRLFTIAYYDREVVTEVRNESLKLADAISTVIKPMLPAEGRAKYDSEIESFRKAGENYRAINKLL